MPLVGATDQTVKGRVVRIGMGEAQTIACMVVIGLGIGCLFVWMREVTGMPT